MLNAQSETFLALIIFCVFLDKSFCEDDVHFSKLLDCNPPFLVAGEIGEYASL